jgi:hypothetical protein
MEIIIIFEVLNDSHKRSKYNKFCFKFKLLRNTNVFKDIIEFGLNFTNKNSDYIKAMLLLILAKISKVYTFLKVME